MKPTLSGSDNSHLLNPGRKRLVFHVTHRSDWQQSRLNRVTQCGFKSGSLIQDLGFSPSHNADFTVISYNAWTGALPREGPLWVSDDCSLPPTSYSILLASSVSFILHQILHLPTSPHLHHGPLEPSHHPISQYYNNLLIDLTAFTPVPRVSQWYLSETNVIFCHSCLKPLSLAVSLTERVVWS